MSIFETAIGLVAPAVCLVCGVEGTALCEACAEAEIIPHGSQCFGCGAKVDNGRVCSKCQPSSPRHVWVTSVYENAVADLVKLYKFEHQRAAADTITSLMVGTLHDFNESQNIADSKYIVCHIPAATSRRRQRGFDHAEFC